MRRHRLVSSIVATLALGTPAFAEPSLGGDEGIGYSWDTTELTGKVLRRTPHSVIVEDGAGKVHALRFNEKTRIVWSEQAGPEDLAPGAKVRAEVSSENERAVFALWILEGPR